MNNNEQQLNIARFDRLVSARLDQVDTLVQGYFEEMQFKWSLLIPQWSLESGEIRKLIDNDGIIRQVFVIDTQKKRQFPPPDNDDITASEKTFVERLQAVWHDPTNTDIELVNNKQSYSKSFKSASRKVVSKKRKSDKTASNGQRNGWYMWYWGSDANLIFWQQNKEGKIVGVELEPTRVKADLISRLPDTRPVKELDDFRLRLLDAAGHVVYQWGNYDNTGSEVKQKSPLNYPLSSWSLEYFGDAFTQTKLSKYSLVLTLAGFGLLICGLAWFLYREQTREIRLASQRVQFVSQVSHELKTPLTNIRMYAEMLEDQLDEQDEQQSQQKRYLQVITDESKRLSRLIGNVLNFARTPRINKRDFGPDEVIKQVIDHFKPGLEAKGMQLNISLNASSTVFSDPDCFEQILNNLLSNAEKYAADGKSLDISSKIESDKLIVKVRDYGKGIARSERKRIFQAFYRINDDITEGVSGTGIGLTIARQQTGALGRYS
ncbi:Sensor histidine kinase ResE [Nymphon striatum]|nr:Sensor histidine kinase ResE [Nymphon striatum]